MHFQRKFHAAFVKFVQYGRPQFHDLRKTGVDHLVRCLREGIPVCPDGRTHESGHHVHAHVLRGLCDVLHLLDGPFADFFRLAGKRARRKVVQAGIPPVAHALAGQMRRYRPAPQAVFFQRLFNSADIVHILRGFLGIQVIAPRGDLHAVVAHFTHCFAHHFKGKVSPLTSKNRHHPCHIALSLFLHYSMSIHTEPFLLLSTHLLMKITPSRPISTPGKSKSEALNFSPLRCLDRARTKGL
ncbi:hypothetical protein SDC9_164309 [bioreactor metagenome]|uniref:Uncharacterized protein n=1 Tax=bioreactor metagenome TaxID=1076179 RepID=A0A645FST5_9ZZZZ